MNKNFNTLNNTFWIINTHAEYTGQAMYTKQNKCKMKISLGQKTLNTKLVPPKRQSEIHLGIMTSK